MSSGTTLLRLVHLWSQEQPELCQPAAERTGGYYVGKHRIYVNLSSKRESVMQAAQGHLLAAISVAIREQGWAWTLNGDWFEGKWSYDATVWIGQDDHFGTGENMSQALLQAYLQARGVSE